jgi:hypothetical protein
MSPEERDAIEARLRGDMPVVEAGIDRDSLSQRLADSSRRFAGKALGVDAVAPVVRRALGLAPVEEPAAEVPQAEPDVAFAPVVQRDAGPAEPEPEALPAPQPVRHSSMGGGGGVPRTLAELRAAQQAQLGALDQEKDIVQTLGVDQAGRALAFGDRLEQDAMRMREDAEDQRQVDAAAAEKLDRFMARNVELADDIARQKIDPDRFWKTRTGAQSFALGLSAALGGALGAQHGGANKALDRIDHLIAQDIQAQETDITNQARGLQARQTIFGQMLQETGDRRLAAMQTRSLFYDSMKQKLAADAERLGIPEIRTKAQLVTNEIDQRQKALQTQLAAQAHQQYVQQAQAAASARRAAMAKAEALEAEARKAYQHTFETLLKEGYGPAEAEREASRQVRVEYMGGAPARAPGEGAGHGGEGGGHLGKAGREKVALEQHQAETELRGAISTMDRFKAMEERDGALTAGSRIGAVAAKSGLPFTGEARKNVDTRNDFNVQVKTLIGAAYKLSTDAAEPKNKELIDEYAKPYIVTPQDTKADALRKIENFKGFLRNAGANKGLARPPEMPSSVARK